MRHEEIQRIYKNHYFLGFRDMGNVKKLVGKVDVVVCFVNDKQSTWTAQAKQQYKQTQLEAMRYIQRTAHSRGVNLQMRNAYIEATVPMTCGRDNYVEWSKAIVNQCGSPDLYSFQRSFKIKNKCDEAPILFVWNNKFRSSAYRTDWETRLFGEMARISAPATVHTIVHELLHQFGAQDLYYPIELENLVKKLNYASVMATYDSQYIDSLTSYLIGWSNEIDRSAVKILECTKHLTEASIIAAIRREHQRH